MPALSSPFSVETLLARCRQTEWKPDMASMLFMNGDDSARGTEQFRTLRSRLYSLREKMTLKILLVTSALPREGKSFTSANSQARCDIRPPALDRCRLCAVRGRI